jgi:hypothetical protein
MTDYDRISEIVNACRDREDQFVSDAYGDGGPDGIFPRLERAAINQLDSGDASFSRYAIWTNTVRDSIIEAIKYFEDGRDSDAKELLRKAINGLSAFSEIQALLDPNCRRS